MKPLTLQMRAFGSYRDESIDFRKLPSGLFLITGDTGSGKTTIFDALVFALYGEASGTDRKSEMLHSDFVDKSVDTEVILTFSECGKNYTVRRSMHFKRDRQTHAYSSSADKDAELTGDDFPACKGAQKVTSAIQSLIGMDAGQFRKIVMLAQGEFRAFLQENKGRTEMIGKLYDERPYKAMESLLSKAALRLHASRDQAVEQIRLSLSPDTFPAPAMLTAEEAACLDVLHPQLEETLDMLCAREKEAAAEEKTALEAMKAAQVQSAVRLEKMTEMHKTRLQLQQQLTHEKTLAEKADAMQALARRLDETRRAWQQVRPMEQAFCESAQLERNYADEESARQTELQALLEKQAALDQRLKDAQAYLPMADACRQSAAQIEATLPQYEKREELQKAAAVLEKTCREQTQALQTYADTLMRLKTEIQSAQEAVDTLPAVQTDLANARHALENARSTQEAVCGKNGLLDALRDISDKENSLQKEIDSARKAMETYEACAKENLALHQQYLDMQSEVLSQELRRRLEAQEEAVCPVCHTHLTREALSHLPALSSAVIHENDIKAHDARLKKAEGSYRTLENTVSAHTSQLKTLKAHALETAARLSLSEDLETLLDPAFQDTLLFEKKNAAQAMQAQVASLEQTLEALLKTQETLRTHISAQETIVRERDTLTASFSQNQQSFSQLQGQCHALTLSYPDLIAAQSAMHDAKEKAQNWEKAAEDAQNALAACRESVNTLQGNLDACRKHRTDAAQKKKDALAAFHTALKEHGFADEDAYLLALAPAREDPEAYFSRQQATLDDYTEDRKITQERVRALSEACAGFPADTDMEQLQKAHEDLVAQLRKKEESLALLTQTYDSHAKVRSIILRAMATLRSSEHAYRTLSRIAGLATSADTSAQMPKGSFSGYAAADIFREILSQANQHLDRMTGGKYELLLRDVSRDKRRISDLQLDVKDHLTQTVRDTASLSGGESFLASLALALGLSSMVQQQSGAHRLEAMFIDEGFGTLSDRELQSAIELLTSMAEDTRQIGIISHVSQLAESIPSQICVRASKTGSFLSVHI